MANTKANSVKMFKLNPAATKQAKVPTKETMIEIEGIKVALKSCKKK